MKAAPSSVARGASERIARTGSQQAEVQDAIRSDRPLDAEHDAQRKLAYIQQALKVNPNVAARVAAYEDPKALPLSPAQITKAESIQGRTVDFLKIGFLQSGRAAARSVARVAYGNRQPQGTGFMVSPRLFLTNHHVISTPAEAESFVLEFNYEEDMQLRTTPVTRFRLDPRQLFLFDDTDDLDFALVAVGSRLDGDGSLEEFGFLPLGNTIDKHMLGIFVNVIQHPEGRPKELVVRENRIMARTDHTLIYGADTLPGASGSPVLNDDWEAIALHHWGAPHRAIRDEVPDLPREGNEGIRISSIIDELERMAGNVTGGRRELLEEALEPPFRHPSLMGASPVVPEHGPPIPEGRPPTPPASPELSDDGSATWTIPLRVSVRIGDAAPRMPTALSGVAPSDDRVSAVPQLPEAAEGFRVDRNYSRRRGYNANFLGIPVPLPALGTKLKKVAARNTKAKPGQNPFEVRYQHFSIVMNGERRLAFFTAVNVDGGSVVRIDRKTGKIRSVESPEDESLEAYEKWFDDDRIAEDQRSAQDLYDHDDLAEFQRGHLVKRTDPSWGTAVRAYRGQADTFHFTNCAPQHRGFNPNQSRWAGLEDWITRSSDDEDLRVTVFSGPVFRADDPPLSYILVPREFWKVVVRVEEGELLATAVLADQTDLLDAGEATRPEDLAPIPERLKEYQCSVREIEELTGLDFGSLRDADTFVPGGESAGRRRIREFADLAVKRGTQAKPQRT
jgi:endonuclease G